MTHAVRGMQREDFSDVWEVFRAGNEEIARQEPLFPFELGSSSRTEFIGTLGAETSDAEHHHLVAEENGRVVGWGHGLVALAPEGYRIGYVSAVYVDRTSRRRGIGSALLDSVLAWLREQDVSRIELVALSRSYAHSLWLRRGFRPLMETLVLAED